jgi:glucosylceramidase
VDFCDGLIYIDEKEKTFALTKRYHAFGSFTKFVPRGSVRVELDCPAPGVGALAFLTPEGTTAVVLRNPGEGIELSLGRQDVAALYVTDDTRDLVKVMVELEEFTLPGRSVCTLVW